MGKIVFCILLSVAALMTNGCAPLETAPSRVAMEPGVHQLSAPASSRKIIDATVKAAHAQCAEEDKHTSS